MSKGTLNEPIPALLQDVYSGPQSNFTSRRTNEVMAFPYKLVQQRSDVALWSPLGWVLKDFMQQHLL